MTRITNFSRKRTYVEAGFKNDAVDASDINEATVGDTTVASKEDNMAIAAPPKKKRKRSKNSKGHAGESEVAGTPTKSVEGCIVEGEEPTRDPDGTTERDIGILQGKSKAYKKENRSKGAVCANRPTTNLKILGLI
jgi:zinc finger CCHC domain-containing protein 9